MLGAVPANQIGKDQFELRLSKPKTNRYQAGLYVIHGPGQLHGEGPALLLRL
jgi:hypothetical protein